MLLHVCTLSIAGAEVERLTRTLDPECHPAWSATRLLLLLLLLLWGWHLLELLLLVVLLLEGLLLLLEGRVWLVGLVWLIGLEVLEVLLWAGLLATLEPCLAVVGATPLPFAFLRRI